MRAVMCTKRHRMHKHVCVQCVPSGAACTGMRAQARMQTRMRAVVLTKWYHMTNHYACSHVYIAVQYAQAYMVPMFGF